VVFNDTGLVPFDPRRLVTVLGLGDGSFAQFYTSFSLVHYTRVFLDPGVMFVVAEFPRGYFSAI
jgi:spermidine synthase